MVDQFRFIILIHFANMKYLFWHYNEIHIDQNKLTENGMKNDVQMLQRPYRREKKKLGAQDTK